jgi:hypothetical protein
MVEKHRLLPYTALPVDPFSFEECLDGAKCRMPIPTDLFELRHTGNPGTWNLDRRHDLIETHLAMPSMGRPRLGSRSTIRSGSVESIFKEARDKATKARLKPLDTRCLISVGSKP